LSKLADGLAGFDPESGASQSVFALMEVQLPAVRRGDRAIWKLLPAPRCAFAYGPYLRLTPGSYRVQFDGDFSLCRLTKGIVLGLEIVAQNRVLRAWRDFSYQELATGDRSITFTVPEALSNASGVDAPFELRFTSFAACPFSLTDVTLARTGEARSTAPEPMRWRLRGRTSYSANNPASRAWAGLWLGIRRVFRPALLLPHGAYRLDLTTRSPDRSSVVDVTTRGGQPIAQASLDPSGETNRTASLTFSIAPDIGLESGMPQEIDIAVRGSWWARRRIVTLDLVHLGDATSAHPSPGQHIIREARDRRKSILVIGNCQANLLARGLSDNTHLARLFSVRHHAMIYPANLIESGRREVEEADLILIQDIGDWNHYPLRDHIPLDQVPHARFPCIRFASLWPFDAYNGPGDELARTKDLPNFHFTYFDGLLARLRREIPDPEARFAAYRDLSVAGLINPARLHAMEEKRLTAMDEQYGIDAGCYILENFRKKRVMYTTGHPNGAVLAILQNRILSALGLKRSWRGLFVENKLRSLQVPVHPAIARTHNVGWANERTRYPFRGKSVTWEEYFRIYIDYYG